MRNNHNKFIFERILVRVVVVEIAAPVHLFSVSWVVRKLLKTPVLLADDSFHLKWKYKILIELWEQHLKNKCDEIK